MRLPLCLLLLAMAVPADPVKVWVTLRDKGPVALTGRDLENLPVYPPYLEQLRGAGFTVAVVLKWQNRASGWIDSGRVEALRTLPFVRAVDGLPRKALDPPLPVDSAPHRPGSLSKRATDAFGRYQTLYETLQASRLRAAVDSLGQKPGQGVKVAVIDAGFYLGQGPFDTLRASGRIRDQWDFVANRSRAVHDSTASPFAVEAHGGLVLSTIAAQGYGYEGLVPQASFLLYRAEDGAQETYVEEDYVAAAIERAVDSGAQVINISLGYRYEFNGGPDLTYAMMDGRTRPASIAALIAARRGALVVVAIGNEAATHPGEPSITSPADADSILTVGIQLNGARCNYSSTGPSFDGRIKPELSSVGLGGGCEVYVANPDELAGIQSRSGTSFAAPVLTGIAALLRQLHPDSSASSQKIRQALMVTARNAGNPDNQLGNGLVRAAEAHCALLKDTLAQTSCALPSVAVKGLLVWRTGGRVNTLAWPTPLDLRGARLWDLQGRAYPIQGSLNEDGEVQLLSGRRLAPGTFILRIPRVPDPGEASP
jgi:serine protease AprX